jgi:hypothetical protein
LLKKATELGFGSAIIMIIVVISGCLMAPDLKPLSPYLVDLCYDLEPISDPARPNVVGMIQPHVILQLNSKFELPTAEDVEIYVSAHIVHPGGATSSRDLGAINTKKEPKAVILSGTDYALRQPLKPLILEADDYVQWFEIWVPALEKYQVEANKVVDLGGWRDWYWFDANKKNLKSCNIPEQPKAWVFLKTSLDQEKCDWQTSPHEAVSCGENVRLCWQSGPSDIVKKVLITYPNGQRDEKNPAGDIFTNVQYTGQKEATFVADAYDANDQVVASDTAKIVYSDGVEFGPYTAHYDPTTKTYIATLSDEEISPKIRVLQYTIKEICTFKQGPLQVEHKPFDSSNTYGFYSEIVNGVAPITVPVQKPFFAHGKWNFKLQETAPQPPPTVDLEFVDLCFSFKGDCAR